jgi:hypothetical protein
VEARGKLAKFLVSNGFTSALASDPNVSKPKSTSPSEFGNKCPVLRLLVDYDLCRCILKGEPAGSSQDGGLDPKTDRRSDIVVEVR